MYKGVTMNIYAATRHGIHKTNNEDRIIVGRSVIADGEYSLQLENGVIAIADGVGGNNAGAVASQFLADKLCDVSEITSVVFENINDELIELSKSDPAYSGMATTLSGICVSDNCTILFSVGNTRVYQLQSGKYLKQLTTDDTTLNYLLSTGRLRPSDVDTFDRKNEITACFGGGDKNLLKMKICELSTISCPIMITSDGVHDHLSVDQMEDIIEEYGISELTCRNIVEAAVGCGSQDDISILFGV